MPTKLMPRTAGWLGVLFVVLLFFSAGMVTLPSSAQTLEAIAAFYAANRSMILLAQAAGLLAVPMFVAFALGIDNDVAGSHRPGTIGAIGFAGILIGVVSVATSIPVIALALTTAGLPLWVRMTDLSDAALFLAIGIFCAALALRGERAPGWLRAAATLVGLFALARSVVGFLGITSVLDVAAPLAFLALVLAASINLLLAARGGTAQQARQPDREPLT